MKPLQFPHLFILCKMNLNTCQSYLIEKMNKNDKIKCVFYANNN